MFFSKITDIAMIRQVVGEMTRHISADVAAETDLESGKLVAFELLTNVLLHSKCPARLYAAIENGALKITVESENCFAPCKAIKKPPTDTAGGRGLFIVRSLCQTLDRDGRKTVAVLRLSEKTD